MTKQEKIIVSAHTGVLMCDFSDVHEYIEKKLSRPVYTHELADKSVWKEIEEKSKEDFLEICKRDEPERKKGEWIYNGGSDEWYGEEYRCSICGETMIGTTKFCSGCGADMREVTDGETE